MPDPAGGCVIVLRRSVHARIAVFGVLVVVFGLLAALGVHALRSPSDRDARVFFVMGAVFIVVPVALWAVNVARCRTVLSWHGIELCRMIRTQWRPWPATRSGFSVSARIFNNEHGLRDFERYRLVLHNGTSDEPIRMPGGGGGGGGGGCLRRHFPVAWGEGG
ncbi:Uncharacterised protein [Propionibacterium australiense]|nr:Uncharacterised protein [Propionibacterium australiense]